MLTKKECNLWESKDHNWKLYCNISDKEMLKLKWTANKHQVPKN